MNYIGLTLLDRATLGPEDLVTRWFACQGLQYVNLQVTVDETNAPIGAWKVHESNDPNADFDTPADIAASPTVYVDITDDLRIGHIQGDGNVNGATIWAFEIMRPGRCIRLVYTPTSGGDGAKASAYVYGAGNG